jgi:sporulation protein YlmC with PRC-barrel domain
MSLTTTEWEQLRGVHVRTGDGDVFGTLREVLLDIETRQPEWLVIEMTGIERETRVAPILGAKSQGETIGVPYGRSTILEAPLVGGPTVSPEEEERLYHHYGLDRDTSGSDTGLPSEQTVPEPQRASRSRRGGSSSKKKRVAYHVTPNEKGGWKTVKEGVKEPVATGRTKAELVKKARRVAKSEDAQLIVHRSDGKIQEERTYGFDPAKSRG